MVINRLFFFLCIKHLMLWNRKGWWSQRDDFFSVIRWLQLTAVAIKTILHFTLGFPAKQSTKQAISIVPQVGRPKLKLECHSLRALQKYASSFLRRGYKNTKPQVAYTKNEDHLFSSELSQKNCSGTHSWQPSWVSVFVHETPTLTHLHYLMSWFLFLLLRL